MSKTHALTMAGVLLLVFGGYLSLPTHVHSAGALAAAETQSTPATTQAARPKTDAELAIEYRLMQERLERVVPVTMNLADKARACATQPGSSSKANAMQAVEAVLAKEQPDAEMLFAAAQVAELCGEPAKAIAILERIADKHANERAAGIKVPAALMAHYRIGNVARHMGDFDRATAAYQEVLKLVGNDVQMTGLFGFDATMGLAEIASEHRHDKVLALARLDAAARMVALRDPSAPAGEEQFWTFFDRDWAAYQRAVIQEGAAQARRQLRWQHPGAGGLAIFMSGMKCIQGGMSLEDFGSGTYQDYVAVLTAYRATMGDHSPTDRQMSLLWSGGVCESWGDAVANDPSMPGESQKAFTAAVPHYQAVFQENSYFAPVAGLRLAEVLRALGRTDEAEKVLEELKARYPGYEPAVNDVRKSWEDKGRDPKRSYYPRIL